MKNIVITGIENMEHNGDLGRLRGDFELRASGEDLKVTDENGKELSLEPKQS